MSYFAEVELKSSNALRLAREAEETARGTVAKLADQSGEWSVRLPYWQS